MIKLLDDFLNGITMYRLMLYCLILLVLVTILLSYFKLIPFNPLSIFFSAAFLTLTCWITNKVFGKLFQVFTNLESVYITALILTLIVTPMQSYQDLIFLGMIAFLSQASKYILAINRKHLFNPAAFAVTVSGIFFGFGASWWVGTAFMMLFVLIVGFLIVRKIQRPDLAFSFFITYLVVILINSILKENDLISVLQNVILESPLLFFAFVMLTEPLTTPPAKKLQMIYGSIVGFLSAYIPLEIGLLLGNIFSYVVSPKGKLRLRLKEKIQIAPDIYDFVFKSANKIAYLPGQYMEWTLGHKNPDNRGNRRYFTIAASPTEGNLRIGVKFYPNSSSFKKSLMAQSAGSKIFAGELSGEFTLPEDPNQKLCFIAGGIGVTPYRSIIKYLLDTKKKRDIILLYSSKTAQDFVYKDIFKAAFQNLRIKTILLETEKGQFIDEAMIKKQMPDFKDRIFYISGPHSMVDAFQETLKEMDIPGKQIKVDFFPGYV